MKLLFKILICFCISILVNRLSAENLSAKYKVSTKNLSIGELFWNLKIDGGVYELNIELKSKGLLSPLYKFSGSYTATGFLNNGNFVSGYYTQKWITKKKKRDVQITFQNNEVSLLLQQPIEKEVARVNINLLKDYSDPITSFLKLLSGLPKSKTIDGRRIYVFEIVHEDEENNKKTYGINEYTNIWADHKRNDLEKISIIKEPGNFLPRAIYIYFKGSLFSVVKKN